MAKKKKKKTFSATKAVKALARERIGTPKASRVEESDPRKPKKEKHKKTFSALLGEE